MKIKHLLMTLLLAFVVPLAANAQQTLTVYGNSYNESEEVPIAGYYVDQNSGTRSEFIIPASELASMNDGVISKMTYYLSVSASAAWNAQFTVYMKEVSQTTLSGFLGTSGATTVYTGVLNANSSTMVVNFSQNYTYHGGNLLVGFMLVSNGTRKDAMFYGKTTTTNTAYYQTSYSTAAAKFIPRVTFEYTRSYDFSAVAVSGQTLYYKITDATNHYVSVISPNNSFNNGWDGFAKPTGYLSIPQTVTYNGVTYTVTAIGSSAFQNCTGLSGDLNLPSSITKVGQYAFTGARFNGTVNIPSSVTTIEPYAFKDSGNETSGMNVNIAGNATSGTDVATWSFYNCKVKTLTLGDGVRTVGEKAFYGCSMLHTVTIGEGVTAIRNQAFWNCPLLTTVHFNAINCTDMSSTYNDEQYSVFSSGTDAMSDYPNIETLNIGSSVQRIPEYAFYNCSDIAGQLTLPSTLVTIEDFAFYNCSGITGSLTIPNNVTNIGAFSFIGCSGLNGSVSISNSVREIGESAFEDCTGITSLTIGESVKTVGNKAFWNTPALGLVNFNAISCTTMMSTFRTDETLDYRSVFSSGVGLNRYPHITTITFGPSVQRIPNYAFYDCKLVYCNLNLPNTVYYIGKCSFESCEMLYGTLTLPDNLLIIEESAFCNCSGFLGALIIPDKVSYIGGNGFYGTEFTSVTIGEGVTHIGGGAFMKCPNMQTVYYNAIDCTSMKTLDYDYQHEVTFYHSVFSYTASPISKPDIRHLYIGPKVQRIPEYAFYQANRISGDLILPNSLITIEAHAFEECTGFDGSLILSDNLVTIGDKAFKNCSGFTGELIFPNTLESIGWCAFDNCSGFTGALTLPNSLWQLGAGAFEYCEGFNGALTLPNNLTYIPPAAFLYCRNLCALSNHEVNIPNCVADIGYDAFNIINNLQVLTIGEGVTHIGDRAFSPSPTLHTVNFNAINCTTMKTTVTDGDNTYYCSVFKPSNEYAPTIEKLNIGASVQNIPDYAFYMCSQIAQINVSATTPPTVGDQAFSGVNITIPVVVPKGYASAYRNAPGWCNFTNITELNYDFEVTTAGQTLYYRITDVTNKYVALTHPYSSSTTPWGDFTKPKNTVKIPSTVYNETVRYNVLYIDPCTFKGCQNITALEFDNNSQIVSIGSEAFFNCSSLTDCLIIPQTVTSIGAYAFKQCAFTDIIVEPATMPTAGNEAFANMSTTPRVYVPYGQMSTYQTATGWSQLTNYFEQYEYIAYNGNWIRIDNWANGAAPSVSNVVCINADNALMNEEGARVKFLYVRSGKTLNVTAKLTATLGVHTPSASSLVIKENSAQHGQLVNPANYTLGTVQKGITGYGTESNKSGWYTVAAPVQESLSVDGLAVGEYDLYYYDEPSRNWKNQKVASNNFTTINPAMGYLYAKQTTGNVEFAGLLNPQDASFTVPVTSTTSSDNLAGFNLVGNPYTYNININNVKINGTALTQYYKVEGGSGLMAYATEEPIRIGEGFLVKATANGDLTFNMSSRGEEANDSYLRLVLSQDGRMADRAYLRLNEGDVLEKMVIDDAQSLLYFEEDDERYAIAPNSNEKSVPLYFEPSANGHFTIAASLLNAECDYLHLIDNLTGNDIDLLETSTYAFDARYTDYTSRFKLVFAKDCYENNDNFAFFSDGEIILSGVNGNSTVQVFDVNGRCISSTNGANRIAVNNMASGVYMLRLINGENVKTQKIVVK